MARKAKRNIRETIILSALELAAAKGWENVAMEAIARKAKISLKTLRQHFEDKTAVIAAFGAMTDEKVIGNAAAADDDVPARERLFDILMERFDILNSYRNGLVSILDSFQCDPLQAVIMLPHVCRSMARMLEAAGIDASGTPGALKTAGLTALYLKSLKTWREDQSPDLAKVMAALDKDLGRAERLANMLKL